MVSDEEEEGGEKFMEELKNAISCSAFIFKVPECVSRDNPDAFLPRLLFLGLHSAKNKMELYKVYMANKVREELHLPKFHEFCTRLRPLRLRILACYDTHLEIDAQNLATIMLVDALFLLRLLRHMKKSTSIVAAPLPNFDAEMNSLHMDHKVLVNDVVKLENQIPFVVFQGILAGPLKGKWPVLVFHFSKSLSPFDFGSFPLPIILYREARCYGPSSDIFNILDESHHLLHFMYLSILFFPGITYRLRVRKYSSTIDYHGALSFFQKWFSRLEAVLDFIQNAMELIGLIEKLVEPITMRMMLKKQTTPSPVIPSASHLHKLPVNFESTSYGIRGTSFTKPQRRYSFHHRYIIPSWNRNPPILTLPAMNINAFTETLFQNLLAFEAMANIHPPVYSHYIHLMKALIRTSKDVQILKEKGIIESHLDDDEQVVKLFHRLGTSISNLNTPTFQNLLPKMWIFEKINEFEQVYNRMIVEINQYNDNCWRVQATRLWKMLVGYAWKMGAILLILYQIYKVAMELFGSVVEIFEPNDDHIPIPPT